jgi:hypothetical protein
MKSGNLFALVLICIILSCTSTRQAINNSSATTIPAKKQLYIFLMAGQSNMAGRGAVEKEDTTLNGRVFTIDSSLNWVLAKEPIHFYERAGGVGSGLAFGKHLVSKLPNGISIAVIPCAVGGSSLEQWLYDSTFRGVKLYSNFLAKAKFAAEYGVVKGILWHQGESNAKQGLYEDYEAKLKVLFTKMRADLRDDAMPVYTAKIGSFVNRKPYSEYVNNSIQKVSETLSNIHLVESSDLNHKGDTLHFNSASQRLLGQRFAQAVINTQK